MGRREGERSVHGLLHRYLSEGGAGVDHRHGAVRPGDARLGLRVDAAGLEGAQVQGEAQESVREDPGAVGIHEGAGDQIGIGRRHTCRDQAGAGEIAQGSDSETG